MRNTPLIPILLLWTAGLVAAGQFAKIAVPFPEVAALYPQSDGLKGWLLSSISLVGAILGLSVGALITRFGTERTLLAGLLLGGALSLIQSAGIGFGWMLFSRLVEGVSHLLIVVSAPTLIARLASKRLQGPAMALWSTFFGVSFALVALIGIPLVSAHGTDALFLAHGLITLVIAAILTIVLKRPPGATIPSRDRTDGDGLSTAAAHLRAYSSANIAAPGAGWFFYTFTFVALLAVLPTLLPSDLRQPITTLMPLLGIVVSLVLAPLMLQAASGTGVAMLGFAVALCAIATSALGTPLVAIYLLIFAAFGLVQSGSFAAVSELNATEGDRALAHGVIAQAGNLGNLIGTPFLFFIVQAHGPSAMLGTVAMLYASAIAAHIAFRLRSAF